MRKNRILAILICICIFLSCSSLAVARNYSFTTLDGKNISYDELVSSPKTVLFAWTTWCPYCRTELNRLLDESSFYTDVTIYYVNLGESKSTIERFIRSQKIGAHQRKKIILDSKDILAEKFSISAIPAYIFLQNSTLVQRSLYLDEALLKSVFTDN